MANNEFAGSALYAHWIHPSGTIVLSNDFRTWSYTDQGEQIDATAGADPARRYINSFSTGQVTCSFLMQSDMGTADVNGLARGIEGTLVFGEAGSVAGKPKITLPSRVDSSTRDAPYNDVASWNVTWSQNGARVAATW